MIDLHCHILPDVDDGPPHYAASIEMAKKAVQCGITDVFSTPHHLNGRYENSKAHILERALEFNHYLEREDIPLNCPSRPRIKNTSRIICFTDNE